ncbi:MAG: helix-hairpin-helix domain-containing protein [Acidobacteriota bacterium]
MRKSLTAIATSMLILFALTGAAMADDGVSNASGAGVVNINTADASQLALLPRVGPKAAERIIEYRKANGGFKKATDLMQVKGVGDKTFAMLSPYLVVEGKTTLSEKQHGPRKARGTKGASRSSKSQPATAAQ